MRKTTNSLLVSRRYMKINTNALYAMLTEIVKQENKLVQDNSKKIHI